MNNLIAVYSSHGEAVDAISSLKKEGISSQKTSIIGKADKAKDAVTLDDKQVTKVAGAETGIGAALGTALGVLTGVGIFAVPGLGFLYGAGAIIGGIAGFDLGLVAGGVTSALTVAGIKVAESQKYDHYIKEGNFLVIVQGSGDDVTKAEQTLRLAGNAVDIERH